MLSRSARRLLSGRAGVIEGLEAGSIWTQQTGTSSPPTGSCSYSGIASRAASGPAGASSLASTHSGTSWASSSGLLSTAAVGGALLGGPQTQHVRTFFGPFRRQPRADDASSLGGALEGGDAAPVPVEAPLDLDLVQQIVDMSTGRGADALAWAGIHDGVIYPTYWAQMLLGNMHDYGALGDVLPWPLALLGCTIVLRTVTFPLHVKQQQMGFNMQVAKPLHDALQKKMQKDIESGVPMADAQAEYTKGTYEVFKTHKSNPMFMAAPLLVNMPLFMGLYWGVSTMCEGNLPSLLTEGLSWCPDLTKPDPYRVWNMAVPAALWVQIQVGGMDGLEAMAEEQKKYWTWLFRLAPFLMAPVMWNFPAAMCMYWTYSNIISIVQSSALKVPAVRKAVGLPTRQAMIEVALKNKAASHSVWSTMTKTGDAMNQQMVNKPAASSAPAAIAPAVAKASEPLPIGAGRDADGNVIISSSLVRSKRAKASKRRSR